MNNKSWLLALVPLSINLSLGILFFVSIEISVPLGLRSDYRVYKKLTCTCRVETCHMSFILLSKTMRKIHVICEALGQLILTHCPNVSATPMLKMGRFPFGNGVCLIMKKAPSGSKRGSCY